MTSRNPTARHWPSVLLAIVITAMPCLSFASPAEATDLSDDAGNIDSEAVKANHLFFEIKPILAHAYAGIDTNALLIRIQERMKWGERDDRLVEAEGIIHWNRGASHLALACFKRLANPGALTMGCMADALMDKGDRYEAADWYLKSARARREDDADALEMYRKFLEIKPGVAQAELELAARLEKQMRFGEAAALFWKHRSRVAKHPETAKHAAGLLASQGRLADAAALYLDLLRENPAQKDLHMRLAGLREAMGLRLEAVQSWTDAWSLDADDLFSRNRAIAQLEDLGPKGEALLQALLVKALKYDTASGPIHFKLAALRLKTDDRKGAYAHLDRALRASPGNSDYLALLPEVIEGDSLIRFHLPQLQARFDNQDNGGATVRLVHLAARGFSISNDKPRACKAWAQLAVIAPKLLEGRRDAFLDLTECGDASSLRLAEAIGAKHLAAGFDREAARSMVGLGLRAKEYPKAAAYAVRLAIESPEDAPLCLAAAKAMLADGNDANARQVLSALGEHAPLPEAAMLLGRMYHASREWLKAAEQFRLAHEAFPEAPRMLGECLAELKNYPDAAAEYETHFARTGEKESLRSVARMYRLLHKGPKEAEVLETLHAKGWAGDEDRLRLSILRADQGDAKSALAIYAELFASRAILPAGEGWSEAAIRYGNHLARVGKLDLAINVLAMGLKSAPAGTPGLSEPWMRLGECLAERKQWIEAHAAFASALAADPSAGEAAAEMLNAAKQFAGPREISDAYKAVSRLDSVNDEANAWLAVERLAARDYRQAAVHFRRVAQYHPADPKAWENLGNTLALVPDLRAASGPLQKAIDLGAQSDEVYINRARAYRLEGSRDMAASILEFLLSRNPHGYLAVVWSAKFAQEDGKQTVASDLFRRSAKLTAPRSQWQELADLGVSAQPARNPRDTKTAARTD